MLPKRKKKRDQLLDNQLKASLQLILYRYRFLLTYTAIGFLSIWFEILIMRSLSHFEVPIPIAITLGIGAGILFAFWFNIRFNFKVPIGKRNRAFLFFAVISAGSASLNFFLRTQLFFSSASYEFSRFLVAGILFSAAYVLHRKYSFRDMKQVGVAVYASGIENIKLIHDKIASCPDFIHVDLIDSTFSESKTDAHPHRLETISAYWPNKQIHVHLMTRTPMAWLDEIIPYADVIIVHAESDDNLTEVFKKIRSNSKTPGLCLLNDTPIQAAKEYIDEIDILMLLTIKSPGKSGQYFEMDGLKKIEQIRHWDNRTKFDICIDGGVSEENVHLLNVELVVSGSSVLNSKSPKRQIMRLQTSNNYEAT